MVRNQFSQLLAPGLTAVTLNRLFDLEEQYTKFCSLHASTRAWEDYQKFSGLGLVRLKEENSPIEYDEAIQGGTKRIINYAFALGIQFSAELIADDQYDFIRKLPAELADSMMQKREAIAAAPLNLAFTSQTTVDGVAAISASHPLLRGGTQSNIHATNMDLSEQAIIDFDIQASTMVDDDGKKRHCKITTCFIPPALKFIARKLNQSDLQIGTANNDPNMAKGLWNFEVLNYLTSSTAYFPMDQRLKDNMRFLNRVKPVTETWDDQNSKGVKHSIYARFGAGFFDYQGWFGSTGLGV